jgi:hypothetical protein
MLRSFRHLLERIGRMPGTDASRMLLASCYGHIGRAEDARKAWAELKSVSRAQGSVKHRSTVRCRPGIVSNWESGTAPRSGASLRKRFALHRSPNTHGLKRVR